MTEQIAESTTTCRVCGKSLSEHQYPGRDCLYQPTTAAPTTTGSNAGVEHGLALYGQARRVLIEALDADVIPDDVMAELGADLNLGSELRDYSPAAFRGALDAMRARAYLDERRRLATVFAEWRRNGTLGSDIVLGDSAAVSKQLDLVARLLSTDEAGR